MSVETLTATGRGRRPDVYLFLKRCMDIVGAFAALTVLFVPCLIIAIAIKLTDRGPILFWQKRVGKDGIEFPFPKFRSMCVDAEKKKAQLLHNNGHGKDGVTFKMKHDPRITPVGRLLRKFSFDEVPQFFCVLRGDMSLVGPRPALPCEVARYNASERRRLTVTPGLTCTWQVKGRGDIPFPQQVELDVQYIANRSLWTDIVLLAQTIPAVLFGRGAY